MNMIRVKRLGGKKGLLPYYRIAQKMLGATENQYIGESDRLMLKTADAFDRGHTFQKTQVGVYFGQEGKTAKDPYFFGQGPDRTGCELCGACMTGCPKDAKNSLDKNYLFFAQKFGAQIIPENKVTDIRPLSEDGAGGYVVTSVKTTALLGRKTAFKTRGIVVSAGVMGTLSLLLKLKENGRLPRLSGDLGKIVRTNSEAILGAKAKSRDVDFSKGVAITSSVHPDEKHPYGAGPVCCGKRFHGPVDCAVDRRRRKHSPDGPVLFECSSPSGSVYSSFKPPGVCPQNPDYPGHADP